MELRYTIQDTTVTVAMEDGLVRIVNDRAFTQLLHTEPRKTALCLVKWITTDYDARFGKQLAISSSSFAIEILGHVYFELLLRKYPKVLRIVLFNGLYDRLCRSCAVIDCGEKGKDPNRRLWDMLSMITRHLIK